MNPDPIGSSSSAPLSPKKGNEFALSANSFPGLKPLQASDPWYKFFKQIFPNASSAELATGSAAFEKNMFQMLENQIKKEQAKEHEAAEKRKRLFLGED